MHLTSVMLLTLAVSAADTKEVKKPAPAAKVTVTAELACLHCNFGEGNDCATCLVIDDKTPLVLEGKAAKQFFKMRFSKKVLVASGTLSVNKDKRLVLTSDDAHLYADEDKDKAPPKGQVRVEGKACCAHCDLGVGDECGVAVLNAGFPIVLDEKLAKKHEEGKDTKFVNSVGKPAIDKSGLLRLNADKVQVEKK